MTTVPPPTAPLPQATPTVATAPVVQLLSPPPAVTALPQGTVLEATVLPPPPQPPTAEGEAAKAIVALRTSAGDVQIPLPVPLPKGTEVELQIVRSTPAQVTVRVVTIGDQPATQALAQLRQAAQPQTPAPVQPAPPPPTTTVVQPGAAWTPQGPVVVTNLGTVSGVVIATPEPPPPPVVENAAQTPPSATPAPVAVATPPTAVPLPAPAPVNIAQLLAQAPTIATDASGVTVLIQSPAQAPTGAPPIAVPQLFQLITGGEVAIKVVGIQMPGGPAVIAPPPQTTLPPAAPVIAPPIAPVVNAVQNAAAVPVAMPVGVVAPAVNVATPAVNTPAPANVPAGQAAPSLALTPATAPATPVIADAPLMEPMPKQPGLVLAGPQGLPPTPPAPPQVVQPQPPLATLSGVVVSNTGAVPVIQTEAGEIQINLRANLPVGTRVVLEVMAQLPPRGLNVVIPPMPPAALPLSGPPGANVGWPTLQESLAVLQRSDPQAASQLAQVIPDGGPRTALAMMSFVQAMRTGNPRQWPGDVNLRALEKVGPRGSHLANQLSEEVSALSSRAREPGPEWRAFPIPWSLDGRVDRIALITRREGSGDDDEAKKKSGGGGGTRFLINLDLSKLGEMQLDGMFRKESRGLDMMIRTRQPLPDAMRADLSGLFATSNAAMGMKGTLSFQVVKKFPDPTSTGPLALDKSGLWA